MSHDCSVDFLNRRFRAHFFKVQIETVQTRLHELRFLRSFVDLNFASPPQMFAVVFKAEDYFSSSGLGVLLLPGQLTCALCEVR